MSKKTIMFFLRCGMLLAVFVFLASCGMMPYQSNPDCRIQGNGVCGRASDVYELCIKDPGLCKGKQTPPSN